MKFLVLSLAAGAVLFSPVTSRAESTAKSAQKSKAEKRVAGSKATAPLPVPVFTPTFWDPNASLQSYQGNDAELVFKWIAAKIRAVKGLPDEFSPPEQEKIYQDAVAEAMAGVGPIPLPTKCWMKKYDPANQEYVISSYLSKPAADMKKLPPQPHLLNLRTATVKTTTLKEEMRVMQNAYGAEISVQYRHTEEWDILYPGLPGHEPAMLLANDKREQAYLEKLKKPRASKIDEILLESDYKYKSATYEVKFPMKSDDARAEDGDLQCMYVVIPTSPYIRSHDQHLRATRDYPKEFLSYGHFIYSDLDRFIVFNKKTGKVYAEVAREKL